MSRNNNGGITAIIITIIVTGGLVYLGVSNRASAPLSAGSAAGTSVAGHHGGASGPISDLETLVGNPAPAFALADREGKTYSLTDLQGKNVVLFFNEGVMCYPACWNQIASFGDDPRFTSDEVVALSIVTDSPQEWENAVNQMPELGSATVLHDTNGSVSALYGMLNTKSSMHYGQLPGHSYVVIDKDGVVRHVYDDPNMAIHNEQLVNELNTVSA